MAVIGVDIAISDKLDRVVADHIEQRLLQPKRLEQILSSVLDRREERAERRTAHIAELRKRASEADAKLKRLYDAIENGVADLSDSMLKNRIAELKAIRDQARALPQRVEVDAKEVRIMGSKSVLLRTLVGASSAKTAGFGVPSFVPKWRARRDSNS